MKSFQGTGTQLICDTNAERSLLLRRLTLNCADVRDRIFGTLGLVQCDEKAISYLPDYNLTALDVAVEVLTRGYRVRGETPATTIQYASDLMDLLGITPNDIYHECQSTNSTMQLGSGYQIKNLLEFHVSLQNCSNLVEACDGTEIDMDELIETLKKPESLLPKKRTAYESYHKSTGFNTITMDDAIAGALSSNIRTSDLLMSVNAPGNDSGPDSVKFFLVLRRSCLSTNYNVIGSGILDIVNFAKDNRYSHDIREAAGNGQYGVTHFHPLDIFAQAARNKDFRRARTKHHDVDISTYLTASFTHKPGSSCFVTSSQKLVFCDIRVG